MISSSEALLSLLERTIRGRSLFQPDDTIIVALSGGADSTALLDLLHRLPGYNLRLVAAHLNHCLRGNDSDADEEFCRQLSAHYSIPFEFRRVDVSDLAKSGGLNLEDAGRRARIDFLDELYKKYGAAAVALAHHADDQAETVLMRLLRGSGMNGLSGMSYRNSRGYVRPLLQITRKNIEEYLGERELVWREDASNGDTAYLRNRIRHELLPALEKYNPAIRSCLVTTATVTGDDEALLVELTEQAFALSCRSGKGEITCGIQQLLKLDISLRRRVLRHAFKQLTGTLEGMSQRHIDAICALIGSNRPNSQLALPHRVSVTREYELLLFRQMPETGSDAVTDIQITKPGHYPLPTGDSLTIEISEPPANFDNQPAGSACFDVARFPFPWRVRTFRPGDRIIPFGMSGHKKVKDVFIDRKIPLSERTRIPLLFSGDDLIWVAGICASELCRINECPASVAKVSYKRC